MLVLVMRSAVLVEVVEIVEPSPNGDPVTTVPTGGKGAGVFLVLLLETDWSEYR